MTNGGRARHLLWLIKRQVDHQMNRHGRMARTAHREEQMIADAVQHGRPVPVPARHRYILHQYGALLLGHNPRRPFPERVLLLRTDGPGDVPDRGWQALVGDALEIVDVAGTHVDLGVEAGSPLIGPVLKQALNRVPLALA